VRLVAVPPRKEKTMLKDWRRVYRKIRKTRGMNEFEKFQMARRLAATPDERWAMNEAMLKALGVYDLTAKERLRIMKDFAGVMK
jgi:phosphopantetheinyl transferase (holo-ACP synthase)